MNLPDLSIRKPVTVFMVFIGIILLGVISWQRLPQELFPPITFPEISVVTHYMNAAPEEIETIITRPIEEAVGSVPGLRRITSVSREGRSVVTVAFHWGIDINFAALAVREKVDLVKELLPNEASDPLVVKFNPLERPIMILSVTGNLSPFELRELSRRVIKDGIEKIDGVASASISGGLEREISINVDQGRLSAAGISLLSIVDALSKANVNYPAGTIKRGLYEHLIRTVGEFQDLSELDYTVASVDQGRYYDPKQGKREYVESREEQDRDTIENRRASERTHRSNKKLVLLKDIAEINDAFQEKTSISRYSGKENISLSIQKQAGSNTISVVDNIKNGLPNLFKELPSGVQVDVIYDHSVFIKRAIEGVRDAAVQGGILAIIILLFFLKDVRSSLIVAVAIPISIMGTFFLMYAWGLTVNMMTLGGLALGVGMLVDNGIVVIENIYRYRQMGVGAKAAAIVGTNEVFSSILASTLTSVAVFFPLIIFVPGIPGQLFKELSWTVIFSLSVSLLVASSLVPLLATHIKTPKKNVFGSSEIKKESLFLSNLSAAKQKAFMNSALVIVFLLFVASLGTLKFIDTELLPKVDQGQFIVKVTLPTGTILELTELRVTDIEKTILELPDVESTAVSIGSARGGGSSLMGGLGSHQGQILVTLNQKRKHSSQDIVEALKKKLDARDFDRAVIEYILQESEFQFAAGGNAPIVVEVRGNDFYVIEKLVQEIEGKLATIKGVYNIKNDKSESSPETKVKINKEKAALYAVSVSEIALTAKIAIGGSVATYFKEGGREYPIRVQLRDEDKKDFLSLGNLLIHSAAFNAGVPLKQVAYLTKGLGPSEIMHKNQERTIVVTAYIEKGMSQKNTLKLVEEALSEVKVPELYKVLLAGEKEEMQDAFMKLMFALILSIALIYMIMASQFESLVQPFVVMFTVPLSLIGVLGILFFTQTAISIIVFLGLIMLGGVVVNNGIILIEYINILRENGSPMLEAAETASRIRLRPILMSSMTSIFGLIPLAMGIGEGSELRAPMAITVIGGLTTSTFLTLIVIPILYIKMELLMERFGVKHQRKELKDKVDAEMEQAKEITGGE
jgi:HAE1 family hydrophobic/amphiphilic exporter-1